MEPRSLPARPGAPVPAASPMPPRESRPKARPRATSVAKLPLESQSREARQAAAAILEVLAGVLTPTAAALALGVSLPRYYALEARAVEGLIQACERRRRGPRRTPERELVKLRREMARLEREGARAQALLRAATRAVGLRPAAPAKASTEPSGKKRRRRRPTARALRAVGLLRRVPEPPLEAAHVVKQDAGGPKP